MINKLISLFILIVSFLILFLYIETPLSRLLYSSFALIWLIKVSSLFFEKSLFKSKLGFFLYLFCWPGISTEGFTKRLSKISSDTGDRFLLNWLTFLSGILLFFISVYFGKGQSLILNYVSLFAIMLIIHLGLIEVIRDFIKLLGFHPNLMFDRPYLSRSLRDFWSFRWNRAFVEMNKIFLLGPLKQYLPKSLLVFLIFFISGILHEVAITYSVSSDYGKPLLYFIIQGVGFYLESKIKIGRIGTLAVILLPIPFLFPPSFVNYFIGESAQWLYSYFLGLEELNHVSLLLKIGACLQAFVLFASIQVPGKLGWKEEFKKLSVFNQKVFWTYGGYIFSIIIFMVIVSFLLSFNIELNFSTFLWILFIHFFWISRVLIDMFYYSHEDWPTGKEFVIGHICLTTLFVTIVFIYSYLLYYVYKNGNFI